MRTSLLPLLFAIAAVLGCSNDDPAPTATERLTGSLTGAVELVDALGAPITDRSGVRVEVTGTSFAATSAADGTWRIDDLPAGTYDLQLSRAGFGEIRSFGYGFVGGGRAWLGVHRLSQKPIGRFTALSSGPDSIITGFDVRDSATGIVDTLWQRGLFRISATIATDMPAVPAVLLVFNTASTVSPLPGQHISVLRITPRSTPEMIEVLDAADVRRYVGRPAGARLYMRAYLEASQPTMYFDIASLTTVRTALSEGSSVVELIVP
jgi:hypothetical protein